MKREIIKQRSRYVKHYDLGHGRRQAVLYPRAVHFRDQDEWKDIDNQLIAGVRDGKAVWHNQDNPMKAEFARNAQDEMLARIEYDGHVVEWGFAEHAAGRQPRAILRANNARKTEEDLPEKMVSGVEYEEANPGVGVRYTLNGAGCKEEIIVRNREALRFASVLFKSNDLSFRAMEDNSIEAFKGGEAVFRFAPPVVSDSGEIEDMPIGFTLTETEAGTCMDYLLAENFLENAVFPIIIDPSVEVVNETTNLDDTFLCQNHPATNYNTKSYVEVGWQDSVPNENVALFRFKELVPLTAGDTVVKAELSLAVVQTSEYAQKPKYVGLYEVLSNWTASTVTWDTFNPNTAGNISDVAQDCIIRTDRTRVTFDITNLYRSWYKVNRNYGVALRRPELKDGGINYTQFRTRNYGSSSAPLLTVTYVSHVGIEKRWDYESMSAGRAGVVNTGVFNGNSVVSHPDIAMDGLRKPIAIGHYYNSCECNDTSYFAGNGWRTSMHQTVHSEVLGDTTHYVWTDGDGTRHYFPIEGSSPYADEDGMNLKLTYNSTTVTIKDRMDNVMTFTKNSGWNKYWLTKMNDSMENAITVTYSAEGKINRVTDPIGRYVQYTYDSNGRLSKLQALSSAGADIGYPYCTYTYSAAGDLINVGYSDITGKTTYAYDNHLLTQMKNYDGQSVTIGFEEAREYDGTLFSGVEIYPALRVLSMEHKVGTTEGAKLLFDYRHMSTHVTSVTGSGTSTTGKKLIYQFSDQGNIVSIRDELGYAAYATYGEELPNHADKASKLQRTVVNMLKNHSFERSEDWTVSKENSAMGTHSFATDQAKVGVKSAKMQRTNASGAMRISQTVNVTSGKTYTLSCFVRTDVSGVTCQARAVCGGTTHNGLAMTSVGEWSRISVTFTATAATATVSFSAQGTAGSAWFDCAQLEEGEVANRYNLVENGNFEYVSGSKALIWVENSENDEEDIIKAANDGLHPAYLGGNVLKIKGYANAVKGVYQEIIAKGSAGDVYVAGGWSKGRSRPTRDYPQRYALLVQFYNGTSKTWEEADPVGWNEEWTEWQYSSGMVEAPVSYSKIRVYVQYEYNVNEAEFDGIALYREAYGERYNYNEDGTLRNVTTMAGNRDIRLYDSYGNLADYSAPGAGEDHYHRKHFGGFSDGDARKKHLLRYQDSPMWVRDVYAYDAYGNQTEHRRQDGDAAKAIYSKKAYTSNGDKLASATDPRGLTVSYAYNNNDTTSQVTMPNGQAVSYTYDAQKRVTAAQASNSNGSYKNEYEYDHDRLTKVKHNTTSDTNDVTYTFGYDAFGKPTTVSVGSQVLSTNTYDTDRSQKLRKVTYGNGQYMENVYDDFNRLTGVKYNGTLRYEYAYGANGQAAKVTDSNLGIVYWNEFDEANRASRMLQMTTAGVKMRDVKTSYDDLEHVSWVQDETAGVNWQTKYFYDWDNWITEIRYPSTTYRVRYTYDGQGRVTQRKVNCGALEAASVYGYVDRGENVPGLSTAMTTNLICSISQPGIYYTYGYASDTDNLTSEKREGGSYAGTVTYAYDSLGQLTRVNDPKDTRGGSTGTTWVYAYDRGGNILNKKRYAYTTGTVGTVQQTITYTYNSAWKDKLATYNGTTLSYDAMGNLTNDGSWAYTWICGRQLRRMYDGTTDIYYGYDHNGLRVSKNVNGTVTNYTTTGGKLTHVKRGSEYMHIFYDGQGRASLFNKNGAKYTYVYNLQGDVVGILDESGSLVVEYKYDAWGKLLGTTGTLAGTIGKFNPLRYRGYVYDEETGLYYLKSRYYNPEWGRFINADVLLGKRGALLSHNLFAYCYNNPTVFTDSSGAIPCLALLLGSPTVLAYLQAATVGILGGMLTDALIDTWTRSYPTFETFPRIQISINIADTRSNDELKSTLGSASQVRVDELNREDLDAYYFAFVAHDGYLMCLNDPLSLEEAKTILYFAKTFKFLAKSCGVEVKYCGIYAFDQAAAEALTSATGGKLTLENHFDDKPTQKGAFYYHYHSGYKWGIFYEHGPHIWFGTPLIRT